MSNKVYDILKWIALIGLPAIGTLYFALAGIWGFPYPEQIVGTITALDTFLGVILGISSATYTPKVDGSFLVKTGDTENTYSLDFNDEFKNLEKQSTILLDVKQDD